VAQKGIAALPLADIFYTGILELSTV